MPGVAVKPELLRWARERADREVSELQKKFPKLAAWERGDTHPTFKQLEAFARVLHVPIGYLFLAEPPEERLPIPDFRTVTGRVVQKPSADLLETIYAMQRRQAWLRENLAEGAADPLDFVGSARLSDDSEVTGRQMRQVVGVGDSWANNARTWQEALTELRRGIERLGVMAVINGVVGNNTHRPLAVGDFRGFALSDPYAPLIFVNGADAKSAQIFTLAHELAHIWLGREGLSGFENLLPGGTDVEDWCNLAAAEFLVWPVAKNLPHGRRKYSAVYSYNRNARTIELCEFPLFCGRFACIRDPLVARPSGYIMLIFNLNVWRIFPDEPYLAEPFGQAGAT